MMKLLPMKTVLSATMIFMSSDTNEHSSSYIVMCVIISFSFELHLFGASLSEPHIDRDNGPYRGECIYLSGCV